METIANFADLASAQLARSLLEAEGIPAAIPDEHLAGIDWRLGTAIQGIRVQVEPENAEEAKQLLARIDVDFDLPEHPSIEADSAEEQCPQCGSDRIGPAPWKRRLKAATLLFPPLIFFWPLLSAGEKESYCSSCKHSWTT